MTAYTHTRPIIEAMKSLPYIMTIGCVLMAQLSNAEEKAIPVGADQGPSKDGKRRDPIAVRRLLEEGVASGSLPEGMVIRLGACLGGPDKKASGNGAPDELRENWEFTANQVRRIVPGEEDNASRTESRSFDSKDLCKVLLEGKAIEIRERKGEGPEVGFVGSGYDAGSRSIDVVWKGVTVLTLGETNGPFLYLYRESDARAFGALYERLAGQARVLFKAKADKAR